MARFLVNSSIMKQYHGFHRYPSWGIFPLKQVSLLWSPPVKGTDLNRVTYAGSNEMFPGKLASRAFFGISCRREASRSIIDREKILSFSGRVLPLDFSVLRDLYS